MVCGKLSQTTPIAPLLIAESIKECPSERVPLTAIKRLSFCTSLESKQICGIAKLVLPSMRSKSTLYSMSLSSFITIN